MDEWASLAAPDPPLDYHWITDRLAVGGGIWTKSNMEQLAAAGITHVVDMQAEFDDSQIADSTGVRVLWNPCDDDFDHKPTDLLRRGVDFASEAFRKPGSRIYFHCAAGVHRGPMMLLAFLTAQGMPFGEALDSIRSKRWQADFPDVYRRSVLKFLEEIKSA